MHVCGSALRLSSILCDMWSEHAQTANAATDPSVCDERFASGAPSSIPENAAMCPRAHVIFGRTRVLSVQTGCSSSPGRIDMNILSLTGSTDG